VATNEVHCYKLVVGRLREISLKAN
jgi:hypothetical protein